MGTRFKVSIKALCRAAIAASIVLAVWAPVCSNASVTVTDEHGNPVRVNTAEDLQRNSGESDQEFQTRKDRLTFGTPANQANCAELRTDLGRCKGGSAAGCVVAKFYKAWCVAPGQDASAALAAIPLVDPNVYYERKNGGWITRGQYCRNLATVALHDRGHGYGPRDIYKDVCAGYTGP